MKAIREANGISLQRLAKDIGRDVGFLSRVERGRQGASDETLHLFAERLNIPITAIIHKETPRDQEPPGAPQRGPRDLSRHDSAAAPDGGRRAAEHGADRE
jgi:transcriptional regulator with XRE-family HTH domain